ncbi:SDR family oxidoreductase [Streptomyces sp. NBC_01775]|uniref:SDR family oxidoreductase n=1 Tax=Streptomyces sp. NBC_01775 TaxID=2975939 RepID=UPI002DD80168|nr:SDR family oxidoreductase [Streptomyces sp. NBC_01775]WSB76785.1 SDR family oxidoreductase [Streptomyces sp. NBC_01775]
MSVVVVTGGTRGVGAGVARAFLRDGAEVVVCGRNAPERPLAAAGREARYLPLDVRDPAAAEEFVHRVARDHGGLDVLVNNAGGTPYRPLAEGEPHRHARVIELNLLAPLHLSRAVHPVMRQQPGGGVILMIGSMSGTRPSPGTAAYGAAKAGLASLAGSMAAEWAGDGIRVNTLVLGMVGTERLRDHFGGGEGLGPALDRTVPLGRLAEPEEVGEACVFLASPRARYITGASLAVHGGGERLALHETTARESEGESERDSEVQSEGEARA